MPRLEWDKSGERLYETGVDNGVLYPLASNGKYSKAVAWNGLTAVNESPSGAEPTPLYADNIKYISLLSAEEYNATIEAYMYPREFEECDGSATIAKGVTIGQQSRRAFGFSYRTIIGNDVELNNHGYKLHLVYGAMASPSEKSHSTVNDSPEATTLSWEITTTPVQVTGYKPTATLDIDSTVVDADCLKNLEAVLYGADTFDAGKTYKVGDYVEHTDGDVVKVYVNKTAIEEAAEWDASKWTEIAEPGLPLPDVVAKIMTPAAG